MSIPTPPPAGGSDAPQSAPAPQPTYPADGQPAPSTGFPPAAPGQPFGAPVAPDAAPKKTNVLALISLIVAAVGVIFACIPGALIVGWVLLPIAFILSIVSLFLKGSKKWMGVVGLILSVVGTIVGFIVFFASLVVAVDDAFGGSETSVTQPTEEDAEAAGEEEAPAAEQGTREAPYPLGSTISSDDWTVVVNSHTPDGAAAVAANGYNDAAPAGSHYEVVNYTVTYTGDESGLAAEVSLAVVTSAGNVVNSYDNFVLLDDSFGIDELYNGASATGSEAFLVPDGETVTIRVSPGMFSDEVFVQP